MLKPICLATALSLAMLGVSPAKTKANLVPIETGCATCRPSAPIKLAQNVRPVLVPAQNLTDSAINVRSAKIPCCICAGKDVPITRLSTGGTAVWTVSGPGVSGSTVPSSNAAWTTTAVPGAGWISPVGNPQTPGIYTYTTTINIPKCALDAPVIISGRFLVDNTGTLIVDGTTIISSGGTPNYGFLPASVTAFGPIPISGTGLHTITIKANNSSGPTGVLIELTATRKCPGDPITGELPIK